MKEGGNMDKSLFRLNELFLDGNDMIIVAHKLLTLPEPDVPGAIRALDGSMSAEERKKILLSE